MLGKYFFKSQFKLVEMKNILDKINDRIYIAKKNNELEDRAIKKNSNMTQRNKTPKKMNNFKA